jgi:small subunit ribosomal protein S4
VISLRGKARQMIVIQWNRDVLSRTPPPWLDSEDEGLSVKVREYPLREHIDVPVREQLIVELYSK